MKVEDLRIGNLVHHKPNWSYRNDEMKEFDFKLEDSDFYSSSVCCFSFEDNIEPITLTEDWLIRLGFISNSYQDRYENKVIHIECNKTRGLTELYIERMPHILYIHQLQNLYQALTGQELLFTPEL